MFNIRCLLTFLLLFTFISSTYSQWIEIATFPHSNFREICFINSDIGFISGESQDEYVIYKTIDGGLSWDTVGQNIKGLVFSINFIDDSIGFITSNKNIETWIFKTEDQGETWNEVAELTLFTNNSTFPTDSIGYVVQSITDYALITKTIDQGNTWEVISSFSVDYGGSGVRDFQFITENIGYVIFNSGIIYKSTDGGFNFYQVHLDYNYNFESLHFLNQDTGFVVGRQTHFSPFDTIGVVFKTTSGGESWEIIDKVFGDCQDVYFTSYDTGYIASHDWIVHSYNSGVSWYKSGEYFRYYMYSLSFPNPSVGYALGWVFVGSTIYSGIYKLDLSTGLESISPLYNDVRIYPNPAKDQFRLTGDKIRSNYVSVYELNGTLIRLIGNVNGIFDISDIKPGMYILKINHSDQTSFNKLIIK